MSSLHKEFLYSPKTAPLPCAFSSTFSPHLSSLAKRITNGQQRTDKLFCSNVFVFTKKVFIAICIFTKLLLHEINVLFKTKRCLSFYVSSEFDTVLFSLPPHPSFLFACSSLTTVPFYPFSLPSRILFPHNLEPQREGVGEKRCNVLQVPAVYIDSRWRAYFQKACEFFALPSYKVSLSLRPFNGTRDRGMS